jgi:hypothetical protein
MLMSVTGPTVRSTVVSGEASRLIISPSSPSGSRNPDKLVVSIVPFLDSSRSRLKQLLLLATEIDKGKKQVKRCPVRIFSENGQSTLSVDACGTLCRSTFPRFCLPSRGVRGMRSVNYNIKMPYPVSNPGNYLTSLCFVCYVCPFYFL